MTEFSECAGNGLTRCRVCNSIGCETWCPRHTLDPDEREADKALRMRVCREIARLKAENATLLTVPDENMLREASDLVKDVDDEAETDKLRKVVEAAKVWLVAHDDDAWEDLVDALAELDGTAS